MARFLVRTITTTEVQTEAPLPTDALKMVKKDWIPENYEIFQMGERWEVWEIDRSENTKTKVLEQAQYYEEDFEQPEHYQSEDFFMEDVRNYIKGVE